MADQPLSAQSRRGPDRVLLWFLYFLIIETLIVGTIIVLGVSGAL